MSLITRKDAVLSRQKIKEASQTYWICDVSATKDDLGFRIRIPLPEGLALTWQWYRKNGWLR